jgi:hypothetical protein
MWFVLCMDQSKFFLNDVWLKEIVKKTHSKISLGRHG